MDTSAGVANSLRSQNPPLKYTIEICRGIYVLSNWNVATVTIGENRFYQGLFQSITNFPNQSFTSQACYTSTIHSHSSVFYWFTNSNYL
jgi:hypothetical protein